MPLDKETLAQCAKALAQLEMPKDEALSRKEIKDLLQGILGSQADEGVIFSLMAEIEEDCRGQIEFSELLRVFERQAADSSTEEEEEGITDAWKALGGTGESPLETIPFTALLSAFKNHFSLVFTDSALQTALRVGPDGLLKYQAFAAFFK